MSRSQKTFVVIVIMFVFAFFASLFLTYVELEVINYTCTQAGVINGEAVCLTKEYKPKGEL